MVASNYSAEAVSRRRFLRQTFAFSAMAASGPLSGIAATLHSDPTAAHLLMIGDWGFNDDHAAQREVAAGMEEYAQMMRLRTKAILMLGDNWYGELKGGARSSRWETQFETMYSASIFRCPFYVVLGNHDYERYHESKRDAELEYARIGTYGGIRTRWTMPARWYRFEFPQEKPLITFLALDSNIPEEADQLSWLEHELGRPRTTPFLAVMAHHPVYSDGPHGDQANLIRVWDPLFRKYHVHVYLAGHDHDLQHLEFEAHPTSFFLSGGGGADLYDLTVDPSKRGPYAQKVHGFSHLSVTADELVLRHVDSTGRTLHAFKKSPEGKTTVLT